MQTWTNDKYVVALIGSENSDSISKAAAECALAPLIEEGFGVDLVSLADFVRDVADNKTIPLDAYLLRQKVQKATALICAAPELDNTYTLLMKQALKILSAEDLKGKAVGCIGLGHGVAGGARAMVALMEDLRAMGAEPLPYGIFISTQSIVMSSKGFEAFSRTIYRQLREFGRDVLFAGIHERSA
jgi:NAD(P)H-dependent FMN reductase